MTRLNFVDCCLLEASGELGEPARSRFLRYLATHPRAQRQFDEIQTQLSAVQSLPRHELSIPDRRRIPAQIKSAIHNELHRRRRQQFLARKTRLIARGVGALSVAATIALVVGLFLVNRSVSQSRLREETARMDRATDRLALYNDQQNPYDQALTDVQSSINQLQQGSVVLATLDNADMSNVVEALGNVQSADVRSR